MTAQHAAGPRFEGADDVEHQVQAVLARRRAANASGQAGEDARLIRAAIAKARPATSHPAPHPAPVAAPRPAARAAGPFNAPLTLSAGLGEVA